MGQQLNQLYRQFKKDYPDFTGDVSVSQKRERERERERQREQEEIGEERYAFLQR